MEGDTAEVSSFAVPFILNVVPSDDSSSSEKVVKALFISGTKINVNAMNFYEPLLINEWFSSQ